MLLLLNKDSRKLDNLQTWFGLVHSTLNEQWPEAKAPCYQGIEKT